ncbi:aldose reductase [Lingula anatina]|uniref:Aldose reductase n=1 Tax=Lingula anatina TaxID=7574 RepID=A0A1S3KG02_LINAN|nr:aldose reductase [Lingula anatina]|eukprot:XP_013421417.1 aldose reductase [Lingula anatina]
MAENVPSLTLNNGVKMPIIGLGTFQGTYDYKSPFDTVVEVTKAAIDDGYRHIDTAFIYDTEKPVGHAINEKIKEGAVTRDEVFITSKLWNNAHAREDVQVAVKKSLQALGMEYIDLFLVHWPVAYKSGEECHPKDADGKIAVADDDEHDYLETWKGMEDILEAGLVKAIGVSNYNIDQMRRQVENCRIKPAALEIETHPFMANEELVDFCQTHGIAVIGYSPLGKPGRSWKTEGDPDIFTNETIATIGKKYNKSPAQVALRYQVQRQVCPVPKTKTLSRLKENIDIFDFELSGDDMKKLEKLNQNFRVLWLESLKHSKNYPFHS